METYKAVIYEPNRPDPKPDRYGTVTLPANPSYVALSPVPLRCWAKDELSGMTKGAYCVIYKIEEVEVERIDQ